MFKYVIASFCDKNKEEIFSYLIETYLSFRQPEVDSQFRLPPDGDVSVEMKLLLQLQPLMVCVNYPVFLLRSCFTCESDKKRNSVKIELFFLAARWLNWKIYAEDAACQDRPICTQHLYELRLKSTSLCLVYRYANWAFSSCFDDNCSTENFKQPTIRSSTDKLKRNTRHGR